MKAEMVPFYDVPTGRVVQIPASELRPGAVQARVEGVEGEVWLLADLQPGPLRHPPFDGEVRAVIAAIHEAFAEHRSLSLAEWEEGFRRDADPGPEIALWRHAADVYREFAAAEPAAERRRAVYRCIVACLTSTPDGVGHVLQPGTLTRPELERIAWRFFRTPA